MSPARHSARLPRAKRGAAWLAAMALAATVLGPGGVLAAGAPASAAPSGSGQQPVCPPAGKIPNVVTGYPLFTDSNVAVFVGGNLNMNASESEGLNIVAGDATLGSAVTGIGSVGGGSQIAPAPGSDMLLVGGNLSLQRDLNVGSNMYDVNGNALGGDVTVGGTITGGTVPQPPADDVTTDASNPLGDWAGFGSTLSAVSNDLGGLTPNGTSNVSGNVLTLTGDGTADQQVFTVNSADLSGVTEIDLDNIKKSADGNYTPIVINVTGASSISVAPNAWSVNGTYLAGSGGTDFGNVAAAVLWNFQKTTDLTLRYHDQFVGSILAPAPTGTVTTTTSINGRLLVGGDLDMDTVGGGTEHHNYPWIGGHGLACDATPAGVTPPMPAPVTPVAPTVTQATCDGDTVVDPTVVPADTDGITYKVDGDVKAGSTVTVTATADTGYTIPATDGWAVSTDGTTATKKITLDQVDCTPVPPVTPTAVTPVAPTATEPTCVDAENSGPSLVLAKTDGVTYATDGDIQAGSTVTVTATASAGHTLTPTDGWTVAADGATATWTHTFADEACTAPTDPGINQGGSGGNSAGGTDPAGTTDPTSTSTGTGTGTGSTTDTTVAADTAVTAASGTKTTAPAKTAAGSNGALAVTGSDLAIPAGLAAALLALGVLLLFARRRKTAE